MVRFERLVIYYHRITIAGIDESISPQHTYNQLNAAPPALDNVDVSRGPIVQSG